MDWCIYQPWRDHWMDRWFMVLTKHQTTTWWCPYISFGNYGQSLYSDYMSTIFTLLSSRGQGLGLPKIESVLGPRPSRLMPIPPVKHPPIGGNISQTQVAIATMTRRLVQHSAFIALCPSRTNTGDVGGDVGPSSTTVETSIGRPERATSEPHRCQSCGSFCFLPA